MALSSATRLNKENRTRVKSREAVSVGTERRLIELTRPTSEFEASCQTDFMMDRPSSPLFMPAYTGCDVATQIMEGDLFDFDKEVEPMLEVLIGKTIQTSIWEVLEEAELASLRKRQEEFDNLRSAELIEVQRMEAAERRRAEETDRRKNQETARLELEKATVRKIVSFRYAKYLTSGLLSNCMQMIRDHGKLSDHIEASIEIEFLPRLVQATLAKRMQWDMVN